MRSISLLACALFTSLTFASAARADVPPPNQAGCDMKNAGDACVTDDDKDGTCVKETCSRLDYSNGTPPSTVEYECILCNGPAAPAGADSNDSAEAEGCSVALPGAAASSLSAAAAIAAGLLLMRRRRSGSVR